MDEVAINGVNGSTGEYLPDVGASTQDRLGGEVLETARLHRQRDRKFAAPKHGVDPQSLASAGWGIIFPAGDPGEHNDVKQALEPLLDLRREQAGKLFRIYEGECGIRPGESKRNFLARNRVSFGPADPETMPYYLLLVGGPVGITFSLQSQLDLQRAVGRLSLNCPSEYRQYSDGVCTAENATPPDERTMTLFGPRNQDDAATRLSCDDLLGPLAERLRMGLGWELETILSDGATKAALTARLNRRPDLLFTASHGVGFDLTDPRQARQQGALLCNDWPGPRLHRGPIPADFCFGADDVSASADLTGMIAVLFACYSLATPQYDNFADDPASATMIAPEPMVAELPRRLLAQGAAAIVGHVDRAWSYSFRDPLLGSQVGAFEDLMARLAKGERLGWAMKSLNMRFAELAAAMVHLQEEAPFMTPSERDQIKSVRIALNDARNYSVLGDPAVRFVRCPT